MNYLEEQTDGEAMINSIKNDDQPLPHVTQVSIAGTYSTDQPPLKDNSMWSDQEKKIQKIDRNGYSRKGQKQSPKRQNRTQTGKDRKRQSYSEPKVKSQSPRSTKVNPEKVKVNPDKAEAENEENTTQGSKNVNTLKLY
nr:hypothetical protein [Tanacetum cinerariifolium]